MKSKAVLGIMLTLTLLFIGVLILTFNVQPVEASGTIYINADGSITPSTANITTVDNITYTFIDNNYDEIIVERDNIIVDGADHTLQGTGSGIGINMTWRSNVTVQNIVVRGFGNGIYLDHSMNSTISRNKVTMNGGNGIWLWHSSYNNIVDNNASINGDGVGPEDEDGIELESSHYNNVINNDVIANIYNDGIELCTSHFNNVTGNNIKGNGWGIADTDGSNGNRIYHNCFIGNNINAFILRTAHDTWDDGYPSGGNYWSNYTGVDANGDGIGDTPYVIDANNTDNYPLMKPWPCETGSPVGGIYIPVNKLELLAPYIGLTILLAVAAVTVVYVKKRKRNTETNS